MAEGTTLKCAYCGKENGNQLADCEGCGTPLRPHEPADSPSSAEEASQDPERAAGARRMWRGALWCGGGLLVSGLTYVAAVSSPGGGSYIIAWGAVLFGAVQFFQGLAAVNGRVDHNRKAQDLLDLAAELESVDRPKAIAVYGEIVRLFPGTAAGREAQANIQTLTTHKE